MNIRISVNKQMFQIFSHNLTKGISSSNASSIYSSDSPTSLALLNPPKLPGSSIPMRKNKQNQPKSPAANISELYSSYDDEHLNMHRLRKSRITLNGTRKLNSSNSSYMEPQSRMSKRASLLVENSKYSSQKASLQMTKGRHKSTGSIKPDVAARTTQQHNQQFYLSYFKNLCVAMSCTRSSTAEQHKNSLKNPKLIGQDTANQTYKFDSPIDSRYFYAGKKQQAPLLKLVHLLTSDDGDAENDYDDVCNG